MATKVSYKQGTKQTYLGLSKRLSTALYFCTDTKELFKGDDLYTDGLRIVDNYAAMPDFTKAADGKIYYAAEERACYVLNTERNGWIKLGDSYDNITIGLNTAGLVEVKAVPIDKVSGLSERLSAIESAAVGGVHYKGSVGTYEDLPGDAAQGDLYEVSADNSEWCFNGTQWFEYGKTTDLSPVAKAAIDPDQFAIDEDSILHIVALDSGKVKYRSESLTDAIDRISMALVWEEMGDELDPADTGVVNALSSAKDGDTVRFSGGAVVQAVTLEKSVTLRGSAAGLAQNYKQEV